MTKRTGRRIDDEPNTKRRKSGPNTMRRKSTTQNNDHGDCSTTVTRQRQPTRQVIGQTSGWNNGAEPYSSAPGFLKFLSIILVPRP